MDMNNNGPENRVEQKHGQTRMGQSNCRMRGIFAAVMFIAFLLPAPGVSKDAPKTKATTVININQASAAKLQTLPGIGRVTARKIVEFREKNGPFRRVEELLIIRGMSVKKLEKIRPFIKVEKAKK